MKLLVLSLFCAASIVAQPAGDHLAAGDGYLRAGKLDQALEEYRAGEAGEPERKLTYQKRQIEALMRQGKRDAAAAVNAEILKDYPDDSDARVFEGGLRIDRGDAARALAELVPLVERAPENPVLRYNLGRAHAARGEWVQAEEAFAKAIELRADYVMARLALAQLQVTRGQFEGALQTAQAILERDPSNTNARLVRSAALMGLRRFEEARQEISGVLKQDEKSSDANFQMGVVTLAEKKFDEAREAFRRAWNLNPQNSRSLMGLVEVEMAQNRSAAALALLQSEVDKSPERIDLLQALGNTAVRAGRYDLALTSFQRARETVKAGSPAEGDILLRIGETYRRQGDFLHAIESLQRARELLPNNVVVTSTLALVLDSSGRSAEAREAYEATLKLDPNNGVAMNNLAFLMAEHGGDLDAALGLAQRARQLLPQLAEISDTLGWIYLKKHLTDRAIETLRELVEREPGQSAYHYHLAMALREKGDRAGALAEAQAALEKKPSETEAGKIRALIAALGK